MRKWGGGFHALSWARTVKGEFVVREELAEKKKRQKKVRISADGTPYTVWQTRTRILCLIYLVWALLEIAVGAGFLTIRSIGLFDPTELVPNITFGGSTVLSGVFNLIIALSGLWGAYDPRRITLFFWSAFLTALLSVWQVVSAWSMGQVDPAMVFSLIVVLAYAACAWNVRGQTGYFDNHPKPEDDELPIQRDQRLLQEAVREKELELAAAKEELEDVKAQFEKVKAEGLAQAHEEAKSISSKLP